MKSVNISSIHVAENRQRRVFDPTSLNELADSIQRNGLLHAIILRFIEDAPEGRHYVLVSGERRLRAIKDIYALGGTFRHDGAEVFKDSIPYTLLSELDALAAEEAELEENIRRADLTWAEKADATARLEGLRKKQAIAEGKPAPTVNAIAIEVRGSDFGTPLDTTRREIIVSKHLDKPEIRAAKSLDEAWKLLKKEEETNKNKERAERVGLTFTSAVHQLHNIDSKQWLRTCPAESFDCILTDPPYGMGADEFGDGGGQAHGYVDTYENFKQFMDVFVPHSARVTKPQAHLYVFCDIDNFPDMREWFTQAGWWVHRTPMLWFKRSGARVPWANPPCGPQRKYETILYAVKGKRNVLRTAGDVLDYPADDNLGHAAQKPVALLRDLLSRSCRAGDSVLDPAAGTFGLAVAAHELKCKAVGCEIDPGSYGIGVKRLEELK